MTDGYRYARPLYLEPVEYQTIELEGGAVYRGPARPDPTVCGGGEARARARDARIEQQRVAREWEAKDEIVRIHLANLDRGDTIGP